MPLIPHAYGAQGLAGGDSTWRRPMAPDTLAPLVLCRVEAPPPIAVARQTIVLCAMGHR